MAKGKTYFWIAPGVVVIDGKEYGAEMPLPVDSIDSKQLKKWIKDGKVGELIAPVEAKCSDCSGLEKQIGKLEKKVETLTADSGDCAECKTLTGEVETLTGDKEKLVGENETLTGDKEKLVGENETLTGDNKKLSGEVVALQADVKEKAALIEKQEAALKKAAGGSK